MTTGNPYSPPSIPASPPASRLRAFRTVVWIVFVSTLLSLRAAVRNRSQLTGLEFVGASTISLILPLVAVWLLSKGRGSGKWILVTLFSLRGTASVILFFLSINLLSHSLVWILAEPLRTRLIEAVFYCGSTMWLLFWFRVTDLKCDPERAASISEVDHPRS
jgi:hypothetical protein